MVAKRVARHPPLSFDTVWKYWRGIPEAIHQSAQRSWEANRLISATEGHLSASCVLIYEAGDGCPSYLSEIYSLSGFFALEQAQLLGCAI